MDEDAEDEDGADSDDVDDNASFADVDDLDGVFNSLCFSVTMLKANR